MTLNKTDLIAVRDYLPGDHNFILSTWLKGLKFGNSWFNLIDQTTYYRVYHAMVESILAKPDTVVKVAVLSDDPDVILGYAVYRKDALTLEWSFVKSSWRGIGVAKMLVPATVTTVTHLTKLGESIFKKRGNLKFDPFR